jgi:hypothetical protein
VPSGSAISGGEIEIEIEQIRARLITNEVELDAKRDWGHAAWESSFRRESMARSDHAAPSLTQRAPLQAPPRPSTPTIPGLPALRSPLMRAKKAAISK